MAFNRVTFERKGGVEKGAEIEAPLLEPGEYEARLVYLLDCGIHRDEYMGEYKGDKQNMSLGFEILGHTVKVDGEEKPRHMYIRPFKLSPFGMSEKSKEYKYYKVFEPSAKDFDVPDWEAQLGKPCTVVIGTRTVKTDNGTTEVNDIDDVVAIPKKYQKDVAKGELEPKAGDGEDLDFTLYGLVRWFWNNRIEGGEVTLAPKGKKGGAKKADSKPETDEIDFDDDIPF